MSVAADLTEHQLRIVRTMGITSLLHQRKWWVDRDKNVYRVKDMDRDHRANLLTFLERNAERLRRQVEAEIMLSFPDDPSDGVWDAMTSIEWELDRDADMHPLAWLHKQPLVEKLVRLEHKDRQRELKANGWAEHYYPVTIVLRRPVGEEFPSTEELVNNLIVENAGCAWFEAPVPHEEHVMWVDRIVWNKNQR